MKISAVLLFIAVLSAGSAFALPLSGSGVTDASTIDWTADLSKAESSPNLGEPYYGGGDVRGFSGQAAGTGGTGMLVVRPGDASFPKRVAVVPEPATLLLLSIGLAGGAAFLRRRKG